MKLKWKKNENPGIDLTCDMNFLDFIDLYIEIHKPYGNKYFVDIDIGHDRNGGCKTFKCSTIEEGKKKAEKYVYDYMRKFRNKVNYLLAY